MARIPLVSEFKSAGIDKAIKEFKRLETTGQKTSYALQQAFMPAAAALGGLAAAGGLAVKVAAEDAAQQADLARQLQATTGATDQQIAAVEEYISQLELAAAVSDNELRPAMEQLVRATGNVGEAQDLMALALDVAAGSGKDLEQVTEALTEAYKGNAQPLAELDKSLVAMIDNGADARTVMNKLGQTFKGAAGKQAQTAAGQMQLMQLQLENVAENVGMILLPLLERFAPALQAVAEWASKNADVLVILATVVGSVAAAIVTVNFAMKAWTAATKAFTAVQAAFNAVMAANPIVLVTLAIAALVAGVIIAYKKVDWFRDLVDKAFFAIKVAVEVAVEAVKVAFGIWIKQYELIWEVASRVFGWITDGFDTIVDFVRRLPGRMLNASRGLFDGIKDAFRSAINWIIDKWNGLEFTIPGFSAFGKTIGGVTIGVPDIPRLAEGGIVTGPTLAVIGEAGPEAVVPLNRGYGSTFNVTVNMPAGSNGQDILEALQAHARRTGALDLAVSGAVRL